MHDITTRPITLTFIDIGEEITDISFLSVIFDTLLSSDKDGEEDNE